MKRKAASGVMLTLLLICMLTLKLELQSVEAEPNTWTVDDDGPADFDTIQEAINNASQGDTIFALSGTYYENVVVNKSVSLIGEDKYSAIIDGSYAGTVMNVTASNVNITNFTIQKSGFHPSRGIYVSSSGNNISNNIITDCEYCGIEIDNSSGNTIFGNNLTNNGDGIFLIDSFDNNVSGNNIKGYNWLGVLLMSSPNNTLSENNICGPVNPGWGGIWVEDSSDNKIYHNNLKDNGVQVVIYDAGSINTWDNGYPSGGNYWSDHNPPDLYSGPYQNETGRDKIGDIPYVKNGNNTDNYPLIYPYGYVPSPDLDGDGFISIADVSAAAIAFGSFPGHLRWIPVADLDVDGVITIADVSNIAINFGKPV